jgi:hypothetical protein
LDLGCRRYEHSDVRTRSGIEFGRQFEMWENVARISLFISFVHRTSIGFKICQLMAMVCKHVPHFFWRKQV